MFPLKISIIWHDLITFRYHQICFKEKSILGLLLNKTPIHSDKHWQDKVQHYQ